MSSGTTSGGTGTGSSGGLPPIVDGGYVFCPAKGSGSTGGWWCPPGAYFCDSISSGYCYQCRSDADCTDRSLPTYDPKRPHCDLSGVLAPIASMCVECAKNADCVGNPAGPYCDTNLSSTIEPPVQFLPFEIGGFDSCGPTSSDCSDDGGPACGINEDCDPSYGICLQRMPYCRKDSDCTGLFADGGINLPLTHCVDGLCSACAADAGACPEPCSGDVDCLEPGWSCLGQVDAGAVCGLSCASPLALACPGSTPICDHDSGFCGTCTADNQCRTSPSSNGYACFEGLCTCLGDSDCPTGESCFPHDSSTGICSTTSPGCFAGPCGFCDWDAGVCGTLPDKGYPFDCITDADCSGTEDVFGERSATDFCLDGYCVECRTSNDCAVANAKSGPNERTRCCGLNDHCPLGDFGSTIPYVCTYGCHSDADCVGNVGPTCAGASDGGLGFCAPDACLSNADCATNTEGRYCDQDSGPSYYAPYGECGCVQDSDCPPDLLCAGDGGALSSCTSSCWESGVCAPGYSCDPAGLCRPRCDDAGQCGGAFPICDRANRAGWNGETSAGPTAGVVWCYGCFTSNDCPGRMGCSPTTHSCVDPCPGPSSGETTECATGYCEVDQCVQACNDAGACPAGGSCYSNDGAGLCYGCVWPFDCPDGQGCNTATGTCGGCIIQENCPPGDYCTGISFGVSGVCLQRCTDRPCPADRPRCEVFGPVSNEIPFCFGCLTNDDCTDAGAGFWCDTSVNRTYLCTAPLSAVK